MSDKKTTEDTTTEMQAIRPSVADARRGDTPVFETLSQAPYDAAAARVDALDYAAGSLEAEISAGLSDWWQTESTRDMLATVPKAIEYGSSDLKAMGAQLVALHPGVDAMGAEERDRVGSEMAIAFYLLGKVARLFGAYERGGLPSDDTIHDVTVYSMMFRRVRETGGWPQ